MEDIKKEKGSKGSTSFKIRKLQKQYNKILTDLFDKYAAESIEEALDKSDASFGENITDIVQGALDNLRMKVLEELGVKSSGAIVATIGDIVPNEIVDTMIGDNDEGSEEESEETEDVEDESEEDESEEETEDTDDTED